MGGELSVEELLRLAQDFLRRLANRSQTLNPHPVCADLLVAFCCGLQVYVWIA